MYLKSFNSLVGLLEKEGIKKGAMYVGTAVGIIAVIGIPTIYIVRKINANGKKEEQDNASKNKRTEKEAEHSQRMKENEQLHNQDIQKMQEKTKQESIIIQRKKEATGKEKSNAQRKGNCKN